MTKLEKEEMKEGLTALFTLGASFAFVIFIMNKIQMKKSTSASMGIRG